MPVNTAYLQLMQKLHSHNIIVQIKQNAQHSRSDLAIFARWRFKSLVTFFVPAVLLLDKFRPQT